MRSRVTRVMLVLGVFAFGVAVGRWVWPWVAMDRLVMVLQARDKSGCHGEAGFGRVWFNRFGHTGDGAYSFPCGTRHTLTDELDVMCSCED